VCRLNVDEDPKSVRLLNVSMGYFVHDLLDTIDRGQVGALIGSYLAHLDSHSRYFPLGVCVRVCVCLGVCVCGCVCV